ncbi:MAG: deoxyribonuclease IV [Chloroflexi bacterium]|nr:deoxyribonuclease IV [Chloroflexota bacterium]
MRIGAHMSAAGGLFKAFKRADDVGCESMLVFTKSNRQWKAKPIVEKDVENYKKAAETYASVFPVAVHASYLINIASPKEDLWEKSYLALREEVERAAAFDIPYITFHPGSFVKSDEPSGLANIAKALRRLMAETAVSAPNTTVCLETMAGQGTNLGFKFEQLAYMLNESGNNDRLGVCFDTCHVFSAGYDFRTPAAYQAMMDEFDQVIGLEHIKCFHFNDSKFDIGQRKDRHAHIGQGFIGREGFANFLNDSRWQNHPAHLETPKTEKDDDGNEIEMDTINLQVLRELRNQS